jgi:glycosyltransferase involved in cell wall biosynthesis
MRILFLTQIVPYPPDAGPKVKTWHVLRYLVEVGHEVTLVTYVRPEEKQYLPVLEQLCHAVYGVPIRRSRLKDVGYLLRSLVSSRPFLIERDDLPEMRTTIRQLMASTDFDILHADQLTMTQFAFTGRKLGERFPAPSPALVFDAHNAVWTILERSRQTAAWYLKPVLTIESRAVRKYEAQLVCAYDYTLTVTEIDKSALLQAVASLPSDQCPSAADLAGKLTVIPIAVDTRQLLPLQRKPNSGRIVTLGTLHYPPNADGIRWFAREVFPLIKEKLPAAHLTIIGKNPPADFQQLASEQPNSITVTGYVDDLEPYLDQSAVMVVPVRAGGGMRVRILEAFARAMPVVTTTVGLEGIDARPGTEVLVEDTPLKFAGATVRLLADPQLQEELATHGRRLAETRYDWQVVLTRLDQLYRSHSELRPLPKELALEQ